MKPPTFNSVAEAVERWTGVSAEQIRSSGRQKTVVIARELFIHLARKLTASTYQEIADWLGRFSHSSVITAHRRFLQRLEAGQWLQGVPLADVDDALWDVIRRGQFSQPRNRVEDPQFDPYDPYL